jgi:hypothetical protein
MAIALGAARGRRERDCDRKPERDGQLDNRRRIAKRKPSIHA